MKKLLLVIAVCFACSEEDTAPVYVRSVHPDLSGYVDIYYTEAAKYGYDLDPNIILDLAPLGEPSPNHYNYAEFTKTDQIEIVFNSDIFYDMDEQRQEALVFFYLSRRFGRMMMVNTYSFMNPQLFVHGYDPADREELIERLFSGY